MSINCIESSICLVDHLMEFWRNLVEKALLPGLQLTIDSIKPHEVTTDDVNVPLRPRKLGSLRLPWQFYFLDF